MLITIVATRTRDTVTNGHVNVAGDGNTMLCVAFLLVDRISPRVRLQFHRLPWSVGL